MLLLQSSVSCSYCCWSLLSSSNAISFYSRGNCLGSCQCKKHSLHSEWKLMFCKTYKSKWCGDTHTAPRLRKLIMFCIAFTSGSQSALKQSDWASPRQRLTRRPMVKSQTEWDTEQNRLWFINCLNCTVIKAVTLYSFSFFCLLYEVTPGIMGKSIWSEHVSGSGEQFA